MKDRLKQLERVKLFQSQLVDILQSRLVDSHRLRDELTDQLWEAQTKVAILRDENHLLKHKLKIIHLFTRDLTNGNTTSLEPIPGHPVA